ncbi:MAG: 2-oxoacid:acceptor oxidoreductase subunit alpha [Bacteroidales bacterium]|nr:2-oxoacid:acceptor oxidoreductase subunit alpha [Bacteroidales bacterium]
MQLTGNLFSDSTALAGNDFATFPDYPGEIRPPQGTVSGVSGFQVHFGHKPVHTTGDLCDVLVAMNPASIKANMRWLKPGTTIIFDVDSMNDKALEKAGYTTDPTQDDTLSQYKVVKAPITSMTLEALKDFGWDRKAMLKSKNMFALGIVMYLFNRDITMLNAYFNNKFKNKPEVIKANQTVVAAGYSYADTMEIFANTYRIEPANLPKGKYRDITGNVATAWGLMAAAEKSGRQIFCGSYPITPATDILAELVKYKNLKVKAFQAEDEIAGICSSLGASFAGCLAVTTTSGPGLSLKSEALGLAVMTELPLVLVDVQRGGPSTGLPTKAEQSDLMQAIYGRNGDAPLIVMAARSSSDCFYAAYEAAKLAMEHMTPVILLTDGSLGNGSEILRIPRVADLPSIVPPIAKANDPEWQPYKRDEEKLRREWAIPGTEGLRHRISGLEKANGSGNLSLDPKNHQLMVELREEKVQRVANFIPEQEITGDPNADLLVVSWGGTYGVVLSVVEKMLEEGKSVAHAHFRHIMPLPKNTKEVLSGHKKILVCENNNGQFVNYLREKMPDFKYEQYNKIQGLPFLTAELENKFNDLLK